MDSEDPGETARKRRYVGPEWIPLLGSWRCRFRWENKIYRFNGFSTEEQAARFYDVAQLILRGSCDHLNFGGVPDPEYPPAKVWKMLRDRGLKC